MNYRHAYHAGNHADVLKHIVLTRTLQRLTAKDKPLCFIDAHAGVGLYELGGIEATKTLEWQGGVGKLGQPFTAVVESMIAGYRRIIRQLAERNRYPGSPWLAAKLLRPQDRLICNELHPQDRVFLERALQGDARVSVTEVDAEVCIKANLPPPERRGLVLIDPPYEQRDEPERAIRMLGQGLRRFATGCFILWYPLKADATAETIVNGVRDMARAGTLRAEIQIRESFAGGGLAGSGVIIVNAPWQLDDDLRLIVPALAERLGLGSWGKATVDWLVDPV